MTERNPTPEADWKLLVRSLKGTGTSQGRMLVEKAILEAGGVIRHGIRTPQMG
jgi:hypothetical protein